MDKERPTIQRLLLVCTLAALGACRSQSSPAPASSTQTEAAATPSKIGAILFETGSAASYGVKAKRGYEMAIDWAKDKKLKWIPEIVYGDSAADESKGVAEFKRLADVEGVRFIVGVTGSGIAKAICPLLSRSEVFVLSALDSAAELSGCSPYFFRIYPSDKHQAEFLAGWVRDAGHTSAAIVAVENAWGDGMRKSVEQTFVARGGKVVLSESVHPDATDFSSLVIKAKTAAPDAIFLLLYPTGARRWLEQASMRELKASTYGGDALTGSEVAGAGPAAEGLMFSVPAGGEGPEYESFRAEFEKRYGKHPDVYAVKSYDAMRLALTGVNETAGSASSLREYFLNMRAFDGLGGRVEFTNSGELKSAKYERNVYHGGKPQALK